MVFFFFCEYTITYKNIRIKKKVYKKIHGIRLPQPKKDLINHLVDIECCSIIIGMYTQAEPRIFPTLSY